MLDNGTKKRIDDCRDILVGKLPDPKSQIEQITIALIYKFMDDMDKEAINLRGTAKFFSGEYVKYSWNALFDSRVTSVEMLKLYSEAIESMEKNPNIPQLFRDIFKNAYLPYRDPETLRLFLKTISEFEYTHSEKLGDAFEYLLSVMGSQGDAGQFRTPRHIIDFIVEAVEPGKNDTILDPACGTAGFLISAFKYIRGKSGKQLTPDEHKRIIRNLVGYDISPDMVRLSLVNLYLHGFTDPHISEYDTLTSEERWNDTFDVVLANPPFMSPKGGIRPHKKFTVSSNRSEVLFVDYIAEHLNPNGKAGVIVPEGIIFQSGKAYKELRKMLVEQCLWAVVSLPAGVFNPYSGVKTSILLMDKDIAKKANSILFVKIENDGYGLGAQRSLIKGSELPEALNSLANYKKSVLGQGDKTDTHFAQIVEKSSIANTSEYLLTGDRYKINDDFHSIYELVELGDVCKIYQPKTISQKEMVEDGDYIVFGANGIIGRYNQYNHTDPEVLITCRGATCGTANMSSPKSWITGNAMVVHPFKEDKLNKKFLFYLLKSADLLSTISGTAQPQITRIGLSPFKIPLPPLSIQEEIVAEFEGYQKIIDGASMVVVNYKAHIKIDPEWEMMELGGLVDFKNGLNYSKNSDGEFVRVVGVGNFKDRILMDEDETVEVRVDGRLHESYELKKDDLLFVRSNGNQDLVGRCILVPHIKNKISFSGFVIRGRLLSKEYLPGFLTILLHTGYYRKIITSRARGANIKNVSQDILKSILVPNIPLELQSKIVACINDEQQAIVFNQKLINTYEQKIKDRINEVWGVGS